MPHLHVVTCRYSMRVIYLERIILRRYIYFVVEMMECLKGIVSIEMVSRPSRVLGYMDEFICYSSCIRDKCVHFVYISMIVQVRAAGIKEIRDRIGSVKNTKKITEAMKLVAAAKVRRAQEAVVNGRPFSENLVKVCGFFMDTKLLSLSFSFSLFCFPYYHLVTSAHVSLSHSLSFVCTSSSSSCS